MQRVSSSPFDPPGFAGHRAPPILFAPGLAGTAGREERDEAAALARRHRLGGPPGLPDPGGEALGGEVRGDALCFTEAAARYLGRPAPITPNGASDLQTVEVRYYQQLLSGETSPKKAAEDFLAEVGDAINAAG